MSADTASVTRVRRPRNPYVGPFPFQRGQHLPNREREAQEVADLVVAERVVLMHAPSGAGKTSLIQAAVLPRLESGYVIAGPVRVDKPVPVDEDGRPRTVHNRYVRSIALGLLCDAVGDLAELDHLTLPEVMDRALPHSGRGRGRLPLLVLDQLEEVLTLDPTDWPAKERFFRELGTVTADEGVWVLMAMREDYMGGLDRYLRFVPGHLSARYRLDFLTHPEARAAIQRPAAEQNVTITDDAAAELVRRLARTPVQTPDQGVMSKPTPYVEPFQLQVVCRRLWKDVYKAKGGFDRITLPDVALHVDVEGSLSRYYGDSVVEIAHTHKIPERDLRDWFERELITSAGFRSQTTTGPLPGTDNTALLHRLVESFIVNSDSRGNTVWYELAHDALIPAVRASNHAWRADHLTPWQNAAMDWLKNGRQREFLLPPELLITAPSAKRKELTEYEQQFLSASQEEAGSRFRLQRYRAASTVLGVLVAAQLVLMICLIVR